ncbi:BolA family protein [Methylibium sp.]|uniref:BolA family protein n=1 Tax=Methylibium sp. TaxID=2067992 RepID=UPI00286A9470|nr:BolA family protein [Methylibium sp.]
MSEPSLHAPPSADEVQAALSAALAPLELAVTDDSHLHAGHAGALEGRHFSVRLVSARFEGLSRLARHRLVYDALASWMQNGIHALALTTLTPTEASRSAP